MASDASPKSAISDVENDEANENHRGDENYINLSRAFWC